MTADTIYALSSAPGRAGVSVVRVSGPAALNSLSALTRRGRLPPPRRASFLPLFDSDSGALIDRALVLSFSAPSSFTGEHVVEYQLHGSTSVVSALFACLSRQEGHRMAAPGEFTRRAFENGKLDLTEAEAVADLINAETEQQRIQALSQMDGALSRLYEGWRTRLVRAMAYVETVIDFPDEDIPDSQIETVFPDIRAMMDEISVHLNDGHRGERLRGGIKIALLGAPNAGKSSLLNRLGEREIAIVSPMAGTTRDVIEAHLDIAGYPVIFADTAGLRESDIDDDQGHGGIESEGIRRAMERGRQSDIKLLLFDGTNEPDVKTVSLIDKNSIVVLTHEDKEGFSRPEELLQKMEAKETPLVCLSSMTGAGISDLISAITQGLKSLYDRSRDTPYITRARHRDCLEECTAHLDRALNASRPEMVAEDLRLAARALGRITGRVDIDDLLDVVFRDFCIGK